MANMILPVPEPPVTSEARPLGRPPRVISSNPLIPVGDFSSRSSPDDLSLPCCMSAAFFELDEEKPHKDAIQNTNS
jgi:hypothetical protein